MIGFALGVLLALSYIGTAVEIQSYSESLLTLYLMPIAIFAVVWVVGFLFTRTLGIACMFAMLGAAAAAAIVLFTGGAAYAPAFLLHAGTYLLCQHGLRSRLVAYERIGM